MIRSTHYASSVMATQRIFRDITATVGNTPLIELRNLTRGLPGRVAVKHEGYNPFNSVKDRIGAAMVDDAIERGVLKPGMIIVEPTSGNTGIGIAYAAVVRGYRCIFTMPDTVTLERRNLLRALGCRVVLTEGPRGMKAAIARAEEIVAELAGRAVMMRQFDNPANPAIHYRTTGPEIWADTAGQVDIFVAGIGTGGTIMGTGRYLKEVNSEIQVIAVEPDDALHGLEGLKHMATSIVPGIYHEEELDGKIPVSTEDAYSMVYRLSQEEGVLVGQSSGAAMFASIKIARKLRAGTIVTIFPDFGDKYLTTNLWVGWRDRMAVGNLKFSI